MKIYQTVLKVIPTSTNDLFDKIEGAFVICWIKSPDSETASRIAEFMVKKYYWEIITIERVPICITLDNAGNNPDNLLLYTNCEISGSAFEFFAWARDGKAFNDPIILNPPLLPDISKILELLKKNKSNGRCLHYESNERCIEIIKAHSIQKKGFLAKIEKNGHVYTIDTSFTSKKKNRGELSYKKTGINQASTFLGFCKKHDNSLFEEIDNLPLKPNDRQVFLYAYRSLCREIFVKENSFNILNEILIDKKLNTAVKELLSSFRKGVEFGLNNLNKQKLQYDKIAKENKFHEMRYILFASDNPPNLAFSGLLYPDTDFLERNLQDLTDLKSQLELITFSSAPLYNEGWGFLFAWHISSQKTSIEFTKSLATVVYDGLPLEDCLFRLAIGSCENHAISPIWWEKQTKETQNSIINLISENVNIFSNTVAMQLPPELSGVSNWKFRKVMDKST